MKKFIPFFLIFALLLTGCGNQPDPSSSSASQPSSVSESTLSSTPASTPENDGDKIAFFYDLLVALEATEQRDIHDAILMNSTALADLSKNMVKITPDFAKSISEAVYLGNPEVIAAKSASGNNVEQLRISFMYDGKYGDLELFKNANESPDQTVLRGQYGEDSGLFTLDMEVFDAVALLITENTIPKKIEIQSDFLLYEPLHGQNENVHITSTLEVGNKLYYLWFSLDNSAFYLEEYDTQTSIARSVMDFTGNGKSRYSEAPFLEYASYGNYDFRLVTNDSIIYFNSAVSDAKQIFEAPTDQVSAERFSFDVHPQSGMLAFTNDDGVYMIDANGSGYKVLTHVEAPQPGDNTPIDELSEYSGFYGDVRFAGDGEYLTCIVYHPGSQSGRYSFAVLKVEDGEIAYYKPDSMMGGTLMVDDNTAIIFGINEVLVVDLITGEQQTHEAYLMSALDRDYTNKVEITSTRDEEGLLNGKLVLTTISETNHSVDIFSFQGESVTIASKTPKFVNLICQDSEDYYVAVVRK